jgi:hypothetical protein
MNITKRIITYICSAVALLSGAGCQQTSEIPDEDLIKIFHDAYLANAYISEKGIFEDSLYLYEPIFERYGYTVEDMQNTLKTFSKRKSALLSDLMAEVSKQLEAESRVESRKIVVLDTIDNVAKRRYTRTVYEDTLIHVKNLRDTNKLRISIRDLTTGEYTVSFTYLIDTLDENRNSRMELYALVGDTLETMRHSMMLSRYREAKYNRKINIDSTHTEIYVNMFYHPNSEESKLPDITIKDFKIVRTLSKEQSVDSLYHKQLDIRIFNHALMTAFVADTVEVVDVVIERDSLASDSLRYDTQDSLTLRID